MPHESTGSSMLTRIGVQWRPILILLLVMVGCARHESSVVGTVTLDGKPLDRGSVSFEPVGAGMLASGMIQSNGSYTLSTNRDAGLAPGAYRVMLFAFDTSDPSAGFQGRSLIPQRYLSTKTSQLEFDVRPGRNQIDIELSSE